MPAVLVAKDESKLIFPFAFVWLQHANEFLYSYLAAASILDSVEMATPMIKGCRVVQLFPPVLHRRNHVLV